MAWAIGAFAARRAAGSALEHVRGGVGLSGLGIDLPMGQSADHVLHDARARPAW